MCKSRRFDRRDHASFKAGWKAKSLSLQRQGQIEMRMKWVLLKRRLMINDIQCLKNVSIGGVQLQRLLQFLTPLLQLSVMA